MDTLVPEISPTLAVNLFDTTCLYEVIETLSYPRLDDAHAWAWRSALETTCALIVWPSIRYAPGPSTLAAPAGDFGRMINGLGPAVQSAVANPAAAAEAVKRTKQWATRNLEHLKVEHRAFKAAPEFDAWFDWFSRNAWVEHSTRLGGLFDNQFVKQIAAVMDRPAREIEDLWHFTSDTAAIEKLARTGRGSRYEEVRDAYTVSTLVRGVYHDHVARQMEWQILHHPQREPALNPGRRRKPRTYEVPNTLFYFGSILLAGAFIARPTDRLRMWTSLVNSARNAQSVQRLDLASRPTEDGAIEAAVVAARRLDGSFHPPSWDVIATTVAGLGISTLTSFTLVGWDAFFVSAGATVATAASGKVPQLLDTFIARNHRLEDLARAAPGRVLREWGPQS